MKITEIDSGCCGMAGSFGYEKEHYEISKKIGSDRLFPAIENVSKDVAIIANGFSCRHQVEHFTKRKAIFWTEVFGE
jgi:Fe-S oxidoreductase